MCEEGEEQVAAACYVRFGILINTRHSINAQTVHRMSSPELAKMRSILFSAAGGAAGGADAGVNPLLREDTAPAIAEHTSPYFNRMLMQVSKCVKAAMGKTTPAHFRSTDFGDRPDEILALLEKRCQEHSLLSIEIPGLLMDTRKIERSHRLAAVLQHCPDLQTLDVSGAWIMPAGWISIGNALASCPKLQVLDVSNCKIERHTRRNRQEFARWLQAGSSLTKVNLSHNGLNHAETDGTLHWITDALTRCTSLEHLDLSRNELGEAAAALLQPALQHCLALKRLDLSRNEFGVASAPHVAAALNECRALEYLDLSANHFDDPSAHHLAAALVELQRLRHLDLSRNQFQMRGASEFIWASNNGMPLTHLDLSDNGIGPFGFADMTQNHVGRGLTYLNFQNNHIDLQNLPDDTPITELPEIASLVHLNLANNRLGDNYIRRLIVELPTCTALTTLNLRDIGVTDAGVRGLPHAIERLPLLTHLRLTTNNQITEPMRHRIETAWLRMNDNTDDLHMDPYLLPGQRQTW